MTKFYFHGGPLDGQQRATGACNPWRHRRGPQRHTDYVLHTFTAGPHRRYGIYTPCGAPVPNLLLVGRLIGDGGLKPYADRPGEDEGERCFRNGCDGVIVIADAENCACHIAPPCGACTDPARVHCTTCDWTGAHE